MTTPSRTTVLTVPDIDELFSEVDVIRALPYPHLGGPAEYQVVWRQALTAACDRLTDVLAARLDALPARDGA